MKVSLHTKSFGLLNSFIKISSFQTPVILSEFNEPYYFLLLIEGKASFALDFNAYEVNGYTILFLSPYQLLKLEFDGLKDIRFLQFHGDFYCIEYHKEEVACNGILFNNIYEEPFITVSEPFFKEIESLFDKIDEFKTAKEHYDLAIARSYLQLLLALCSKEKQLGSDCLKKTVLHSDIQSFNTLLDLHFTTSKSVGFYASQYGLSVDAFSKKIRKHYGKAPSKLIQERLILESKKLLHLTYKSIKEIAATLGFEDEFYFSKYFKKGVGVSPKTFREQVGISIVAEKSR